MLSFHFCCCSVCKRVLSLLIQPLGIHLNRDESIRDHYTKYHDAMLSGSTTYAQQVVLAAVKHTLAMIPVHIIFRALKKAADGDNIYRTNGFKTVVNAQHIPITVGSFNSVFVHTDDSANNMMPGYPVLCHVGNEPVKQRAFYVDPLYSIVKSYLPAPLKRCMLNIGESRTIHHDDVFCTKIDLIPTSSPQQTISVIMRQHGDDVQTLNPSGQHSEFMSKVLRVYTDLRVHNSVSVGYSVFGLYSCWSCRKMVYCKYCSACGNARYCSTECQKAHWKQHKKSCNKLMVIQMVFK